jgi:hypothetical protein
MRRWVLSSLLALVPVAVAWLGGVYRLARVPGLPAGWYYAIFPALLIGGVLLLGRAIPREPETAWLHGVHPASDSEENAWYITASRRPLRIVGLYIVCILCLILMVIISLRTGPLLNEIDHAILMGVILTQVIGGLLLPEVRGPESLAVAACGVYEGSTRHRWEDIELVVSSDEGVFATIGGKRQRIHVPESKVSNDYVAGVIRYYLRRPEERATISMAGIPRHRTDASG